MQVINCCKRQLLIDSAQRSILVYINAICANRTHYHSNYRFDTVIAFCSYGDRLHVFTPQVKYAAVSFLLLNAHLTN